MIRTILLLIGLVGAVIIAMLLFLTLFLHTLFNNTNSGVVQHRITNPASQISAVVVRDDCGATCGCKVRLDLEIGQTTRREIYRDLHSCDLDVYWRNDMELIVFNNVHQATIINISLLNLEK
jgi:hypothetical protein